MCSSEEAQSEVELLQAMFSEQELVVHYESDCIHLELTLAGEGKGTAVTLAFKLASGYPVVPAAISIARSRLADEAKLSRQLSSAAKESSLGAEPALFNLIEITRMALDESPPCFICLEPQSADGGGPTASTSLPCCHCFHNACLAPWFWRLVETARSSTDHVQQQQQNLQAKADVRNQADLAAGAFRNAVKRQQVLEDQAVELKQQLAQLLALNATNGVGTPTATASAAPAGPGKTKTAVAKKGKIASAADIAANEAVAELQRQIDASQSILQTVIGSLSGLQSKAERAAAAAGIAFDAAAAPSASSSSLNEAGSTTAGRMKAPASSSASDLDDHLAMLRRPVGTSTDQLAVLRCPYCRGPAPYSKQIAGWYEPWLRKEHQSFKSGRSSAVDAAAGGVASLSISAAGSPATSIWSADPPSQSSASTPSAAAASGSGAGSGGGGGLFEAAMTSIPSASDVHVPDTVSDQSTRAYLAQFQRKWLSEFTKAAHKGGIIGIRGDSLEAAPPAASDGRHTSGASPSTASPSVPVQGNVPSKQSQGQKAQTGAWKGRR